MYEKSEQFCLRNLLNVKQNLDLSWGWQFRGPSPIFSGTVTYRVRQWVDFPSVFKFSLSLSQIPTVELEKFS